MPIRPPCCHVTALRIADRSYNPFWVINLISAGAYKGSRMAAKQRGSAMGAERDRVAEFGKLEDGLLQAGGGDGAGDLQRRRERLGLPAARSGPVPGLPVGGGRPGRVLRHPPAAVPVPG